jgi:aspartate/methionine/tyrosine aminotransferase
MDMSRLLSSRSREVDASGIRRVSDLAKSMPGAVNLSIGQPDFAVPEAIKDAAVAAIRNNQNGYTANPGLDPLRAKIAERLGHELGWSVAAPGKPGRSGLIVTGGTSGAILLACLAVLSPGDEIIVPDPYFIIYPQIAAMCGARAVLCDTYPDFRMTAERIERLITPRTKMVLLNSPGNPSGVVMSSAEVRAVWELCRARNVLLLSDEIYDEFCFSEARTERPVSGGPGLPADRGLCPSPARVEGAEEGVLLVRGFGKTWGCTGWRLGYAAGPMAVIEAMIKFQQHTFVCAPTPLQHGVIAALDHPMDEVVERYQARRDRVMAALSPHTRVQSPGGAYYAFVEVPERLGMTAQQFCDRLIEDQVLVIPGNVFSRRDTHFRLSFACEDGKLARGLDVIARRLQGR